MFIEICISVCVQKGINWVFIISQRWCYCGNGWNYGFGVIVFIFQCIVLCNGKFSEVCGDYYKFLVYDIIFVKVSFFIVVYFVGYQGCYEDIGSCFGMMKNSWMLIIMI